MQQFIIRIFFIRDVNTCSLIALTFEHITSQMNNVLYRSKL